MTSIDLTKALYPQVGRLGKDYTAWVHAPSTAPHFRMFETDFVEFFASTPFWVVPVVWLPVVAALLLAAIPWGPLPHGDVSAHIFGATRAAQGLCVVALVALGGLLWTLLEYCIHRFLFHAAGAHPSPAWATTHFVLHGQHHKFPLDKGRLVMPPAAALVGVVFFYTVYNLILPWRVAYVLGSGTLAGYVAYDLIHYYLHHAQQLPRALAPLRRAHMNHHFKDIHHGFGISSSLWDVIFGSQNNATK